MFKEVCFAVRVPKGDYCFDGHHACPQFRNDGGHGVCSLGMCPLSVTDGTYIKPINCWVLPEISTEPKNNGG